MTHFEIKIVSDTVCPWCYIGQRRLLKAIHLHQRTVSSADTFSISWAPFYLDPAAPTPGVPLRERMASRFGGAERVAAMTERLARLGRDDGIRFSFDSRVGATRDSHRLIQLAKTKSAAAGGNRGVDGTENAVVTALFREYFERDGDITDRDMLVRAGVEGGLDEAEAREWLETGKGGDEVDAEVEEARRKQIHGVPDFTIQGEFVVQGEIVVNGAQDPTAFLETFIEVKKLEESAAAARA